MEYSIYSYGGGEILWKVFNGIALLFKSDSNYLTSVGKLTMAIGLIYAAVQAIPRIAIPIFLKSWFLPTLFLTAIFFGPKSSVHIIDKVDLDFQYSKVENIPVGIALVASLTTHVSEYLTDSIETVFMDSYSNKFSKTGPMFASRLIHEARSVTIKDPMMRENIKDFSKQCFAWPYVFSNIAPGKKAALESKDILGFVASNPHPLLGVYWRGEGGQTTFKNCSECVPLVRSAMAIEVESGLKSLAMKLFDGWGSPEDKSTRLKAYFGNAWQSITNESSTAANVIQQELMINSYRIALQDKRDELGMGRLDDSLIYMNAERGRTQQNASFLVKAAMSGIHVPTLHTILFALALIYFALIAPMTFLPKGLSLVATWAKIMVWLSTWPVLMSILNSLGNMFAAKAASTQLLEHGGLCLMTQTGLSDVAFDAYCFVMGLQWSVPPLSWALISGGGYAFSQMSSSFTQGGEAFAGKASSEMVDGNVSFDNQTLGGRSIANSQIAQQQLGPSINTGSRFDDGKIASLHGPNGQTTIQEHQTSLGTNVSQNDSLSAAYGVQSDISKTAAESDSKQAGYHISQGCSETLGLLKSMTDSTGTTDTFGKTTTTNKNKALNDCMNTITNFAKDNNMSEEKAFKLLMSAGLSTSGAMSGSMLGKVAGSVGGALGALFGAMSGAINGQFDVSASDRETMSKAKNSGVSKQFTDTLTEGLQNMEDHKSSTNSNYVDQKANNITEHFNKAKQYNASSGINRQNAQAYRQQASLNHQKGITSGSNYNDPILKKIAQERFGGDIRAASDWQATNPISYQEYTSGVVGGQKSILQSELNQNGFKSEQDIDNHYVKLNESFEKEPTQNENMENLKKKHNIEGNGQKLKEKHTTTMDMTKKKMDEDRSKIKNDDIQNDINDLEGQFEENKGRYLISKAGRKVIK